MSRSGWYRVAKLAAAVAAWIAALAGNLPLTIVLTITAYTLWGLQARQRRQEGGAHR